ncbi:MAG: hypothetical protein NVSMB10_02040 [Steroidobacteraceae bacterium]
MYKVFADMRLSHFALSLVLALGLAGCNKDKPAEPHAQSAAPPAAALTRAGIDVAPRETAAQRQEAGLAPAAPGTAARVNEDGSETVVDSAGEAGTRSPLLLAVASTMAAATATAKAGPAAGWQEGVNYTRLVPAQPSSVPPGQVEVLEFFWYGCPHCYAIDPLVESWRKSKPAYVAFSRVPVMWSETHRSTARLYYALESLGKLEALHGEVFKEIHVNANPLVGTDPNDAAGAERVQAAFLKKFGVSEDAYKKAAHSFSVETALQRAEQLGLRYRIEGVPTFIINGKYMADVRSAGTPEKLVALVNDLAAQEHKH